MENKALSKKGIVVLTHDDRIDFYLATAVSIIKDGATHESLTTDSRVSTIFMKDDNDLASIIAVDNMCEYITKYIVKEDIERYYYNDREMIKNKKIEEYINIKNPKIATELINKIRFLEELIDEFPFMSFRGLISISKDEKGVEIEISRHDIHDSIIKRKLSLIEIDLMIAECGSKFILLFFAITDYFGHYDNSPESYDSID